MLQCWIDFFPLARLETTIRIHPQLFGRENLEDEAQFLIEFLYCRHTWRVYIVDSKSNVVGIAIGTERLQEIELRARSFDEDHISIHTGDFRDDVIKL